MTAVGTLAETSNTNTPHPNQGSESDLVSWVMERVNRWRDDRNQQYEALWGEYYRLWRGRHIASDKTRTTERSRLVNPALAQALEMTVAELEEATFGREAWIDLLDDAGDPDHEDINGVRKQFLDDLEQDKVPDAIAQSYLNGGLWGTLAAKIVTSKESVPGFVQVRNPDTGTVRTEVQYNPRVAVKAVPIPVMNLIPDPEGDCVEDMLGIAHEVAKPRAWLLQTTWGKRMAAAGVRGTSASDDETPNFGDQEYLLASDSSKVLVTEYHGLVPRRLLPSAGGSNIADFLAEVDPLADAVASDGPPEKQDQVFDDEGDMVEAIVTVLDKTELGRAIENPFLLKDRSIVAAPFEKVPGLFFGRGVMEKGYNPQKALDAEVRTRMDVMALIANPMMGADSTALPRGFNMTVRPGKVWITNGNPKEALFPIQFPGLDPASFNQSSEMERMVQVGTGAMDTATPVSGNPRNETATGTSLIAGTFVKRSKRALRSLGKNFVSPLITKILWRRMQFDPQRYPKDFSFRIVSTMGIVARELEQQQMTQMLALVEPGSQVQGVIVESIVDNSASPFKAKLQAAIKADQQPTPEQQEQAALQKQLMQMQVQSEAVKIQETLTGMKKTESDVLLNLAKVETELAKPGVENAKLQQAQQKLQIEFEEVREFGKQNQIAAMKVIADANRSTGVDNGGTSETD